MDGHYSDMGHMWLARTLYNALIKGEQKVTYTEPKLPLAQMAGAKWNMLEAGGCRIACFLNEADCTEALRAVEQSILCDKDHTQTMTFDQALTASLLMGKMKKADAQYWQTDECPLFAKAYAAVLSHLEREGGENPFCVFYPAYKPYPDTEDDLDV